MRVLGGAGGRDKKGGRKRFWSGQFGGLVWFLGEVGGLSEVLVFKFGNKGIGKHKI